MGDFTGLVEAVSNLVVSLAAIEVSADAAFIEDESAFVELLSLPPEQEAMVNDSNAKHAKATAAIVFLINML